MITLMYSLWIITITAYRNRDNRDNRQVSTRLMCLKNGVINRRFPFPYIAHVNNFCITHVKLSME